MNQRKDRLAELIAKVISESREPLETTEVRALVAEKAGKEVTRSVLLYRLNNLRGEGVIRGKQIGSGKGNWIWWKP